MIRPSREYYIYQDNGLIKHTSLKTRPAGINRSKQEQAYVNIRNRYSIGGLIIHVSGL